MNLRNESFSGGPPGVRGIGWIIFCVVMVGCVAAGWALGALSNTCLALIAVFALSQGVLPYFRDMAELDCDKRVCVGEREALIEISTDDVANILAIDDDDAGSVLKLVKWMCLASGRATMQEAEASFFAAFDAHWESRVSRLQDVAAYAPTLGISGTMLGVADAAAVLAANGGDAGIASAMVTMSMTTLAGGVVFVLISGLARRAANEVAHHRSDLKFVATMLHRGGDPVRKPRGGDGNPCDYPGVAA